MSAYYNEIDPYAAQWLRNLIEAGHIAPGVVDERSIEDVKPDELMGYTQCHFFAGVGVWSLALRRAGWPDNRPVWTGSCPCQPFSAAGAGAGFADPRHLWPSFAWLIKQCAPPVVIGEQVASKAVEPWVDLVQADLEALGYAFGAIPFPSAGVGAPHIRDRLYWVADASTERLSTGSRISGARHSERESERSSMSGRMAKPDGVRLESQPVARLHDAERDTESCGGVERMGDHISQGLEERVGKAGILSGTAGAVPRQAVERAGIHADREPTGPVNGFWRAADWLGCRDGKWRPVEPGTFPLATGASSRVGRLRAYGNAINAQAAKEFIAAYMEAVER